MTTPKELAEEFRRLAAEAERQGQMNVNGLDFSYCLGKQRAYEQAAQMVEDKL